MIKTKKTSQIENKSPETISTLLRFYYGYHVENVYRFIKSNNGVSRAVICDILGINERTVDFCFSWLFRLDFIYSDFEDDFCSKYLRGKIQKHIISGTSTKFKLGKRDGGVVEKDYFFSGEKPIVSTIDWALSKMYFNMGERSVNKRKVFDILANNDDTGQFFDAVIRTNNFPLNFTVKDEKKIKRSSAVKYFHKPFNAIGFPARNWAFEKDIMWWMNRVRLEGIGDDYSRSSQSKFGREGLLWLNEDRQSERLHKRLVRETLEEMGMKFHLEKLSYWISAMSTVKGNGNYKTTVKNFLDEFQSYFSLEKNIRMIEVKFFYTTNDGSSKYEFLNTNK